MEEVAKKEVQDLLQKFAKEDKEIGGLVVFDEKTEEIIATTYSSEKAKEVIAVRKEYRNLGVKAEKIYPAGKWNWGMTSLARYVEFGTNLVGDYQLAGEFTEAHSPSACIEDALEISLMINDILS
ncbi:MAG: hypothetical protein NTW11_01925 [Candidatus Staskawiczbacteria bacterium]|nr:hypothetical protein [Candidatus Staskawiczbacteria bacterium]